MGTVWRCTEPALAALPIVRAVGDVSQLGRPMAGQVQQALVDAGLYYNPNGHPTQLMGVGVRLLITYE